MHGSRSTSSTVAKSRACCQANLLAILLAMPHTMHLAFVYAITTDEYEYNTDGICWHCQMPVMISCYAPMQHMPISIW